MGCQIFLQILVLKILIILFNQGMTNILVSPNGKIHRKLSRLALTELGDNFLPFSYGQMHVPIRIAVNYKIPFVMYGENGELEYGGSMKNLTNPLIDFQSDDYIIEQFSPSNQPTKPEQWSQHFTKSELQNYVLPSRRRYCKN